MSAKSSFKPTKLPPPPPEPRPVAELEKEAQKFMWELAQVEYQAYVYKLKADQLKNEILKVNQEGAARKQLDDEAAKAAGASNEQS